MMIYRDLCKIIKQMIEKKKIENIKLYLIVL